MGERASGKRTSKRAAPGAAPAAGSGTAPAAPATARPDSPAAHATGPATGPAAGQRREATVREAKAMAHPLRLRILRLCLNQELTNKQLAERLGRDPGTVLYHVRHLTDAGLLEQGPVRTGESGALEKPYRSTGLSWWLSNPQPEQPLAPIEAFNDELREAGPDSVQTHARFALHLSKADIADLDRRIAAILDEYIQTDDQRRDHPLHGGIFVLHRLAEPPETSA